jgi:hypothetical protein
MQCRLADSDAGQHLVNLVPRLADRRAPASLIGLVAAWPAPLVELL